MARRERLRRLPAIADDGDNTAYYAYGAGGLPYIVYLDKDNKVALRTEGEYGNDPEIYTDVFAKLAAGQLTSDPRGELTESTDQRSVPAVCAILRVMYEEKKPA